MLFIADVPWLRLAGEMSWWVWGLSAVILTGAWALAREGDIANAAKSFSVLVVVLVGGGIHGWVNRTLTPDEENLKLYGPARMDDLMPELSSIPSTGDGPPTSAILKADTGFFVSLPEVAALKMIRVGDWMSRRPSTRIAEQGFVLNVGTNLLDAYGAPTFTTVLQLKWSAVALRRVHWKTITSGQILDLAAPMIVHPSIDAEIRKACASGSVGRKLCLFN